MSEEISIRLRALPKQHREIIYRMVEMGLAKIEIPRIKKQIPDLTAEFDPLFQYAKREKK